MATEISKTQIYSNDYVLYTGGYRYQTKLGVRLIIPELIGAVAETVRNRFIQLEPNGHFTIQRGYAWDGPSGPMPDWDCVMRASLFHDALYQLIRERLLDVAYRKAADAVLVRIASEDGTRGWLCGIIWKSVRAWGLSSATPGKTKPTCVSPNRLSAL